MNLAHILVILVICHSNALDTTGNDCFILSENVVRDGSSIIVSGVGRMCPCLQNNGLVEFHSDIKSLQFTEEVTSVGSRCFENLLELESVTFNSNIIEIGEYSFYRTNISQLTIPENVVKIHSYAFSEIYALKTIIFDESDQSKELILEGKTFSNCYNLIEFNIPRRLLQFDSKILDNCISMSKLTVAENHQK